MRIRDAMETTASHAHLAHGRWLARRVEHELARVLLLCRRADGAVPRLLDEPAINADAAAAIAGVCERSERVASSDRHPAALPGQFVRATITTKRNAEIVISRVYRGHLARRRCRRLREQDRQHKRESILSYCAVVIQKSLRGMHSRRAKLDFRIRKAYVTEIATKGEEMRRLLNENLRQQQLDEQRAVEEAAQKELVEVTQNLHHLESTRAISGVYNAPMLPAKTLKPYPPSNKAAIQASSAYGADLKEVRTQKKYHKLRRLSASDFQTVHNAARDEAKKLNQPGINAGLDYLDDWNNPYKKRGVPRSKEDLLPRLTTLEKAPKKPFHLTYGGNKSKVLPNDRFDV